MLSVRVICVGKLGEKFWKQACDEYVKRLQGYCRPEVIELPEQKLPDTPSSGQIAAALKKESTLIREKIPQGAAVIAMCVEGKTMSSEALAQTIGNLTAYNRVPECVAAHEAVQGKNGKSLSFAIAPAFRRKGLMYEAVSGVIEYLFREEKADYINCGYLSYNGPSKALQEKLGFTYLLTEQFTYDGQEKESIENILWRK